MRRATAILLASITALALFSGAAFAGKGATGNWDSGTKSGGGTANKQDRGCPSDYTAAYSGTEFYNWVYDLNLDGWICYKWTGDQVNFIDNTSNH